MSRVLEFYGIFFSLSLILGCSPRGDYMKLPGDRVFPMNPEFTISVTEERDSTNIDFNALYISTNNSNGESFTYFRFWPSGQVLIRSVRGPLEKVDGDNFDTANIGFYETSNGLIRIEVIQINPGTYRYDYLVLAGRIGGRKLVINKRILGRNDIDQTAETFVARELQGMKREPDW